MHYTLPGCMHIWTGESDAERVQRSTVQTTQIRISEEFLIWTISVTTMNAGKFIIIYAMAHEKEWMKKNERIQSIFVLAFFSRYY